MSILPRLSALLPPLTKSLHKGSLGKICVIGGCYKYTGAPYFSGITALRMNCDLSTILCTASAAAPIKSYSPDLMVYACLPEQSGGVHGLTEEVKALLLSMTTVVIGPGLGRNEYTLSYVSEAIEFLVTNEKKIVVDGDGLFLIARQPKLIQNYAKCVLLPNAMEFRRLWEACLPQTTPPPFDCGEEGLGEVLEVPVNFSASTSEVAELSRALGGVCIVRKGVIDIISDSNSAFQCGLEGTLRRCGGQGDILSGAVGAFIAWGGDTALGLSALGGCVITRTAAKMTFEKVGRCMLTSDILASIPGAFSSFESAAE